MSTPRETVVAALFKLLQGCGEFVTASRRLMDPEGLGPAETPALFLMEDTDHWDRSAGFNQLPKRTLMLKALIYTDVGATNFNALPATFLNNTLDAIEAAFQPDNVNTGAFTLGNLVEAATIDGTSQRASGDVTGKGMAVVPIRILLP